VAILVPSYKENIHLVRQTLLSVALQEYPNRRVALLIDDPPFPTKRDDLQGLLAARRLTRDLQMLLDRQARLLQSALDGFLTRQSNGSIDTAGEMRRISRLYADIAAWFLAQAANIDISDHTDRLFAERILLARAETHAKTSAEFQQRAKNGSPAVAVAELLREYRRLAWLFRVKLDYFERKRFINLSHELNKAMNLNSYIELVGGNYRLVATPDGIELRESDLREADISVPDAKYLIVVDADSLLMPGYSSTLIGMMERPENQRLAVAQSPYLPVPRAPGLLERTAAATVAVQYVVHLGFAQHEAIYWVGANAVLRKEALDEICTPIRERGYTVVKYIQDRTHIEDTESTIDLVERGWTLHNCADQLAYSATPADFGSLLIQRRRWANGGLIILPKLIRYLAFQKRVPSRCVQGFLRVGYLLNLSLGSLAIVLTLLVPLPRELIPFLTVAGICYAFVYTADMIRMGFRLRDLPHVYALNLMLTPVNLGGAAKSIRQAWTGKKTPFARTPKTKGRTWIPPLYIGAEFALLMLCFFISVMSLARGHTGQAIWALINGAMFIHITANLLWDEAPDTNATTSTEARGNFGHASSAAALS
jgi:cellulose synthase/poly-beta-1,6-N-acetylglucosamine synthase-like glycosyltransferase